MKSITKTSKRGIIVILTLCSLLVIPGAYLNVATIEEAISIATGEEKMVAGKATATTGEITPELMPMMASWSCYDYNTVDDCMKDISSKYGFSYSPDGNSYTCSGTYSVSINNSHNYLNVILSYNGSCIKMFTYSRR